MVCALRDNVTLFFNTLYIYIHIYKDTTKYFLPCKEYIFSVTLSPKLANALFSMLSDVTV
jgi:hypothetical protein